jgi:hypothetical protein
MKKMNLNVTLITLRDLFAKYSENKIMVFIVPKFELEDSMQKIADKLNLDMEEIIKSDFFVKEFSNIFEAQQYVMDFRGEYLNYFTVECYHNGKFITENT